MSIGLILTIIIYLSRVFLVNNLLSKKTTKREAALISFMIPKGLAAAVLAEIPTHMNLNSNTHQMFLNVQSIVYAVIFFSILLTAILVYNEESKSGSLKPLDDYLKNFD